MRAWESVARQNPLHFEEARAFVRPLGLKGETEWRAWAASGKRPPYIPSNPDQAYAGKGWTNWGDWLGTRLRIRGSDCLPYGEARAFVRALGLKNFKEWQAYAKSDKRPPYIPASPEYVYAGKGWVNWGDWLGTRNVRNGSISYLPYEEACAFVRPLGLKNQKEWRAYAKSGKRPPYIPATPHQVYAGKGWTNWGDWLRNRQY